MTFSGRDPNAVGGPLVFASWIGTGAFAALAGLAAAFPDALARPVAAVDGALFVIGCVAFIGAYARAVSRSRFEVISVIGVFFLAGGAAPSSTRRWLLGALGAQIAIALVTASLRPYTPLAFGVLVPVFGLGITGLWGARHGQFPDRSPGERDS